MASIEDVFYVHANAELLDITGMPSSASAAAMIEAHLSDVHDTKIASIPPAALSARAPSADMIEPGEIRPTTESWPSPKVAAAPTAKPSASKSAHIWADISEI